MAVNVDMSDVVTGFMDSGKDILAKLEAFNDPEVVKSVGTSTEKLVAVQAEDVAKFLPSLYRNDFALANDLANIGRALNDTVHALSKVDRKAGIAIGVSLLAAGGVYYLWTKHKAHEARINSLEQAVVQMNSSNVSAIGF